MHAISLRMGKKNSLNAVKKIIVQFTVQTDSTRNQYSILKATENERSSFMFETDFSLHKCL